MTNRKIATILAVVSLVGLALFGISRNFQYVDNKAAIAFGDQFINTLREDQVDAVFRNYDSNHINPKDAPWTRLLAGLTDRYGKISSHSLVRSSIIPVSDAPCTLLQYEIHRGELITQEKIIVCPVPNKNTYVVAGHELVRTDTGQRVYAGLAAEESSIRVP